MLPHVDGPSVSPIKVYSILIFLLLIGLNRGESQLVGPQQSVVALVDDDIILPCHLEPAEDVTAEILEWMRSDLTPRFVHVWRAGQDLVNTRNPSYRGRTSLFIDALKNGNISLKLSKVKVSDEGTYECHIPLMGEKAAFKLVVASDAAVSPVISLSGLDKNRRGVVLQCESAGWYPEPELLWLDAEGNLLPAAPAETLRGPDGLYAVSSRVTVEKKHSNKFTCRVQQKNINQSRETHIHVPDVFFMESSPSARSVIGGLIVVIMCIIILLLIWKWRTNKTESKKNHTFEERIADALRVKMEILLKKEGEHKGGSETLMNQGQVDIHHSTHVSEQPGLSKCENEHISISPDQVTQNENQQNNNQPGRDATNDVCRDENTQSADKIPSLTETHPEPVDNNIEIPNQSLMDNSGKQQQLNKGEDVKKDTDKKTTNDETAGQSPREEEGKQNTEGKNNPDVQKEDGDKTGATNKETAETRQPNPTEQPEEGQKHQEDDNRSISKTEPPHPENNGTDQQSSDRTDQLDVKEKKVRK